MEKCYIDKGCCSGARFSFCDNCKTAKQHNKEAIANAQSPVENSLAHIFVEKEDKTTLTRKEKL